MSKSINTKTKSIQEQSKKRSSKRELKRDNKPRGQSGTHRLKQLKSKQIQNTDQEEVVIEEKSWLKRIFRK